MLIQVPATIHILFIIITFFTIFLIYRILHISNAKNTSHIFSGLLIFIGIQALVSLNGVYISQINLLPPRLFLFGILPILLTVILLFVTNEGRKWMDQLDLESLCYLNIVRVPVEFSLLLLYMHKAIPELMTFAGRNFDILAGITAPFISYFGIKRNLISKQFILTWNFLSLGLLINIIIHAFLSTPSPLQKIAFDQPNIAILHFPYSWLATFIAPMIFIGHLITIRSLFKQIRK